MAHTMSMLTTICKIGVVHLHSSKMDCWKGEDDPDFISPDLGDDEEWK